jgi:hypothetical protein
MFVKIFSGLSSVTFLQNSAILQPPIFYQHQQFFGASFEFFDRKFGHLATVNQTSTSAALSVAR